MFKKYIADVLIFKKRGGEAYRPVWDKGRRSTDKDGASVYYLKRESKKEPIKPILYKNLFPIGKRELIILYSPSPTEFYDAPFDAETKNLKVVAEDHKQWYATENQKSVYKYLYKTGIDKYMPIIMILIVAIALGIVITLIFNATVPAIDKMVMTSHQDAQSIMDAANNILIQLTKCGCSGGVVIPH